MLTQDLAFTFSKDNVIYYERKLIQSQHESLPKPASRNESKYSVCQLSQKIKQLIQDKDHNLRWIGNNSNSQNQSYIYCILMLSISTTKTFMQFKNIFYELCRKCLQVKQQKLIIEFLCLLQYSSDKFLFLKRYPLVQRIIYSVFDKLLQERDVKEGTYCTEKGKEDRDAPIQDSAIMDSSHGQLFHMNKLAQLYAYFSVTFNFLQITRSSGSSFQLRVEQDKKMFIIVEKQYFFVLQLLQQSQVISSNSKLSKCDKIQVQRLLQLSENKEKHNFQLQQNLDKLATNSINHQQQKLKSKQNSDLQISKKDFKFNFLNKKPKNQNIQELNTSNGTTNLKKLQCIDLMDSSFEVSIIQTQQQNKDKDKEYEHRKNNQSNSFKFYKPKFFPKPLNLIPTLHQNKIFSTEKHNKTEIEKGSRYPLQTDKRFITMTHYEDKQRNLKSKQTKLFSPPKLLKDSPYKKSIESPHKKIEIIDKKVYKLTTIQSKKQFFKVFDKKHQQKNEEIQKNHINYENRKQFFRKIPTSISNNPEIFNNRISLQSRKDIDFLFKLPKQDLIYKNIPEANENEQSSKRQLIQNKNVRNLVLYQSLNNKSQVQLKKKIFEHCGTKVIKDNLSFISKRNKSLEQKQTHPTSETLTSIPRQFQQYVNSPSQECPQIMEQNQINGGYEIRINLVQSKLDL